MNKDEREKYIEEYENMSLYDLADEFVTQIFRINSNSKLLEEIYINYDYERDKVEQLQKDNEKLHHYKTLYQSLKKQKEDLRDWLEEKIQYIDTIYLGTDKKNYSDDMILDMSSRKLGYKDTLNKLEELEGVSNE